MKKPLSKSITAIVLFDKSWKLNEVKKLK